MMLVKLKKNSEHETKDYRNKALEKAKKFAMTFEDSTKDVTDDKHENHKCQKNLNILKLIIEAVLHYWKQGVAL